MCFVCFCAWRVACAVCFVCVCVWCVSKECGVSVWWLCEYRQIKTCMILIQSMITQRSHVNQKEEKACIIPTFTTNPNDVHHIQYAVLIFTMMCTTVVMQCLFFFKGVLSLTPQEREGPSRRKNPRRERLPTREMLALFFAPCWPCSGPLNLHSNK